MRKIALRLEHIFDVVKPEALIETFDLDGSYFSGYVEVGVTSVRYRDCFLEKQMFGESATVVPELTVDGVQLFTAGEREPCLQTLEKLFQFLICRVFNDVVLDFKIVE